jgi:uncharacterized OB-fold protein
MSTVGYTGNFRTDLFTVRDGEVRLLGSQCGVCQSLAFPKHAVCAVCLSADDPRVAELGPGGVLYTFAIVRQAPREFPTPYVIGYVDLDQGVRVFTQIVVPKPEELRLGARMRATLGPVSLDSDGAQRITYVFTTEIGA